MGHRIVKGALEVASEKEEETLRARKGSLSRFGANAEDSLSGMTGDRWVRWQGKWVG